MFFVVAKLLAWLAEPGTVLLLLIVIGLVLADILRWRWGRPIAWLGVLGFVAIAALPIDDWLARPLEDRFPPLTQLPDHVDGVIVLGGAIDPVLSDRHGRPALDEAGERMTEFVRLAHRYPDAKLIFTGGSAALLGGPPEADAAKQLFADLGLDTAHIMFERRSRDTYENALYSRSLADPRPGEVWILVTSATHMPRAVGIFRHQGWPVVADPVGYKTAGWRAGGLSRSLRSIEAALHEWLGLAAYWAQGRTDSLFPAP